MYTQEEKDGMAMKNSTIDMFSSKFGNDNDDSCYDEGDPTKKRKCQQGRRHKAAGYQSTGDADGKWGRSSGKKNNPSSRKHRIRVN